MRGPRKKNAKNSCNAGIGTRFAIFNKLNLINNTIIKIFKNKKLYEIICLTSLK